MFVNGSSDSLPCDRGKCSLSSADRLLTRNPGGAAQEVQLPSVAGAPAAEKKVNSESDPLRERERPVELFRLQATGLATIGREGADSLAEASKSAMNNFHVSKRCDTAGAASSFAKPYIVHSRLSQFRHSARSRSMMRCRASGDSTRASVPDRSNRSFGAASRRNTSCVV